MMLYKGRHPSETRTTGESIAMLRRSARSRAGRLIDRADRARDAKQWAIAARRYQMALDQDPANAPIWVQYGHALKESGRQPQAEAAYRAAIFHDPGSAEARLQLGHVLKIQEKRVEAEATYLLSSALDPTLPDPIRELAGLGWSEAALAGLPRLGSLGTTVSPNSGQGELQDAASGAARSRAEAASRLAEVLGDAERSAQWSEAAVVHMQAEIAAVQDQISLRLHDPTASAGGATNRAKHAVA
jgi:tetratricopeptide (TPR) repeat protein